MIKAKISVALGVAALIIAASATSAFAGEWQVEETPITAQGSNHTFTTGTAVVKCTEAHFLYEDGIGSFKEIRVMPTYGGKCEAFGAGATITSQEELKEGKAAHRCGYRFNEPVEDSPTGSNKFKATVNVINLPETSTNCKEGITIKVAGICTVTVGVQGPLGGSVQGKNITPETKPMQAEVISEVNEIHYTHSGLCPGIGNGADGKYAGAVLVKGGLWS